MNHTTNPQDACRTTQHCAYHGWCRRCDPAFAETMSQINIAIQRTDADESHWGPLYEAVGKALRAAVSPSAVVSADRATLLREADEEQVDRLAAWLWNNCAEDERTGLLADDPRKIAAVALRWPELRRVAAEDVACATAAALPPCGECGHRAVHRPGDDPVTPGECTACHPDNARHDYRSAVGEQPAETQDCGRTKSVDGTEYPPCARPAGHEEAYCRSADGNAYFLAMDGHRPAARPAVGEQPDTQTPEAAPVHAVPLPGSNGISSCCGRPPCEFVGERLTRNPDEVTCPGPTAP